MRLTGSAIENVAMMIPVYRRLKDFHYRYREFIMVCLGIFWTASALFLVLIAFIVFAQQSDQNTRARRETTTNHAACERSRVFGPPLIRHLERVENRLHLGALEGTVIFEGKRVPILSYYRSTIPESCPK